MHGPATFELFVRRLPPNRQLSRRIGGLDAALDYLERLRFGAADIAYLASLERFSPEFLEKPARLPLFGARGGGARRHADVRKRAATACRARAAARGPARRDAAAANLVQLPDGTRLQGGARRWQRLPAGRSSTSACGIAHGADAGLAATRDASRWPMRRPVDIERRGRPGVGHPRGRHRWRTEASSKLTTAQREAGTTDANRRGRCRPEPGRPPRRPQCPGRCSSALEARISSTSTGKRPAATRLDPSDLMPCTAGANIVHSMRPES